MATVLEECTTEEQRSVVRFFVGKKLNADIFHVCGGKCLSCKDFYAAGFDALVKRWDKCINGGGGYVEK
jgi:hypothetical protein